MRSTPPPGDLATDVLLRSPLLAAVAGIEHGFSTRAFQDRPGAVEARAGLGVGGAPAAFTRAVQVHGRAVWVPEDGPHADAGHDAVASASPDAAPAVITADCVPVLLVDPDTRAVAAAHAGWRGLVCGILPATVEVLTQRLGARAGGLRAAIGPCIGPCCYEVSDDVVEAVAAGVRADVGALTRAGARGRPHLDLRAAAEAALRAAGLDAAHVDRVAPCTSCEPERFCSYRRGERGARQLSYVRRLA